jgi:predicted nucleic acid-binding protein
LALYYLDTSALVKLYVREPGTEQVLRLARGAAANQIAVLALAQVEIHSALRRRERAGEIASAAVVQLLERFHRHLEAVFLRQVITEATFDVACGLVDRHGLFALDAVQLAGYVALRTASGANTPIFVSADRQLLEAAEAELAPVLDPCSGFGNV